MSVWHKTPDPAAMQTFSADTIVDHLGIEFLEVGDDYLTARMPVDRRTHQPFRLLHGGASVVLAETLGSIAAQHCCEEGKMALGLGIDANHLRSVPDGWVYGRVTPIHVGRTTQVWNILIENEAGKPVCTSRLTVMVVDQRG